VFVNEESYSDWFKDWKDEPYALDASPFYLYSLTAPYEFLEKPLIAKETKVQLLEHYSEEIDKLSNLAGRNLIHWKH
jgi:hypothetical protein